MTNTATLDSEITSRISAFADELAGIIRRIALESVQNALGVGGVAVTQKRAAPGRPRGRKPGRPKKAASSKPKAAPSARAAAPAAGKRGPGRPPNPAVLSLMPEVAAYVKSHDGAGISDISKGLKKSSDALKPVLQKLVDEKKLRRSGQKRGTKYHAR